LAEPGNRSVSQRFRRGQRQTVGPPQEIEGWQQGIKSSSSRKRTSRCTRKSATLFHLAATTAGRQVSECLHEDRKCPLAAASNIAAALGYPKRISPLAGSIRVSLILTSDGSLRKSSYPSTTGLSREGSARKVLSLR